MKEIINGYPTTEWEGITIQSDSDGRIRITINQHLLFIEADVDYENHTVRGYEMYDNNCTLRESLSCDFPDELPE